MSNFFSLLSPNSHRACIARLLLAVWAMLVLPALAHPLHEMPAAPHTSTATASEHCAEHPSPAPADSAHSCLCLQACASAVATLAATPALPQLHNQVAPQFAVPNNYLPASPASTPYRPPIAAHTV